MKQKTNRGVAVLPRSLAERPRKKAGELDPAIVENRVKGILVNSSITDLLFAVYDGMQDNQTATCADINNAFAEKHADLWNESWDRVIMGPTEDTSWLELQIQGVMQIRRNPIANRNLVTGYAAIPSELKDLLFWATYGKDRQFIFKNGGADRYKAPYNPKTGQLANTHYERADFATALRVASEQCYWGLGFGPVPLDLKLSSLDFDHCIDSTGAIDPRVVDIMKKIGGYWEYSPSGTGLRSFVWWQHPGQEGRKVGSAEIYPGNHFMTITGNQVPGTENFISKQDATWLYDLIDSGEFRSAEEKANPVALIQPSLTGEDPIPYGMHEKTLFAIAARLRGDGLSYDEMLPVVERACVERCIGAGPDWQDMCKRKCKSACDRYKAGSTIPSFLVNGEFPQSESVAISAPAKPDPSYIRSIQLEVEEGEEPQWQDICGEIHDGIMPPEAANDFIEIEVSDPNKKRNPKTFRHLTNEKRLKKRVKENQPSWLTQRASIPHIGKTYGIEWTVDRMFPRHCLSLVSGDKGAIKTTTGLLLATEILRANKNEDGTGSYLGRSIRTKFDDGDLRPIRFYYIVREGGEATVRSTCKKVGIDEELNADGLFQFFGHWEKLSITNVYDPRLEEAARCGRAYFLFDTLSRFLDGADENNNSEMTPIMDALSRLAQISEGVLVLGHNSKAGGSRGASCITTTPDMCFKLSKSHGNNITISEDRFRLTENYTIKAQVFFGPNEGLIADNRITYKVLSDTLDPETRKLEENQREASEERRRLTPEEKAAKRTAQKRLFLEQQTKEDAVLIKRAFEAIENREIGYQPSFTQNSLANELGVINKHVKSRVLCAPSPENPRPWVTSTNNSRGILRFFSSETQRSLFEGEGVDSWPDHQKAERAEQERVAREKIAAEKAVLRAEQKRQADEHKKRLEEKKAAEKEAKEVAKKQKADEKAAEKAARLAAKTAKTPLPGEDPVWDGRTEFKSKPPKDLKSKKKEKQKKLENSTEQDSVPEDQSEFVAF